MAQFWQQQGMRAGRQLGNRLLWVAIALVGACGGSESDVNAPPGEGDDLPDVVLPVVVADPVRGARLFANTPRVGELICADCHGEMPTVDNFGNIWSGRNAMALIQRAVSMNTGGMGYLASLYGPSEFADIAAYLGNTPASIQFQPTPVGSTGAARPVAISASTKVGLENLSVKVLGDFALSRTACPTSVPRLSSCVVEVVFKPMRTGARVGAILISHDGTPAPVSISLLGDGV